jgi:hypothetical protein
VSGRTVDTRRVHTYVRGLDAAYGVQLELTQPTREYCGLDAVFPRKVGGFTAIKHSYRTNV